MTLKFQSPLIYIIVNYRLFLLMQSRDVMHCVCNVFPPLKTCKIVTFSLRVIYVIFISVQFSVLTKELLFGVGH